MHPGRCFDDGSMNIYSLVIYISFKQSLKLIIVTNSRTGTLCYTDDVLTMDFREKQYEGINALVGLTMAEFDKCGIGGIIADAAGEKGGQRILPVASVVKMIVGAMMTPFDRVPLYHFDWMYASAPVDLLFGGGVRVDSLNPSSISRALDIIFTLDTPGILWKCASECNRIYGLDSDTYHIDATNFSVYAITENCDAVGAPSAMFGGNSKTGRNDLRQYDAMTVTDGNRVLRYLRAYSGNTSDTVMDKDVLEFLYRNVDPKESTVVADCKLVSADLIRGLQRSGMGFISKCPKNFSEKVRESVVRSAESGGLDDSVLGEGYGVYDTDAETECGTLRFIAYRTPHDREDGMRFLEEDGERRAAKAFTKFRHSSYHCPEDAEDAVLDAVRGLGNIAYAILYAVREEEHILRRKKRGRPAKDSAPPRTETVWKIDVSYEFDPEAALKLLEEERIQVIVTNIPRRNSDRENIRSGATADTVVRTYLDEYKAEHTYRLLKSGIGMDRVYLHKGSRVAAMMFIAGIAGMLSSVMDAVLRRGNADKTVYLLRFDFADTTVRLKRPTGYVYVDGHEGVGAEIEECCRILDLDPDSMIGTGRN